MTSYVNGYSVGSREAIGIKTYKAAPGVLLPVRSSVAPLLIGAAKAWHTHVEPLHPGWCWGYSYRRITGGSGWSWHAAGIAIDLNAPLHPYGDRDGNFTEMQAYMVRAIAAKFGLRAGLDYRTNQDGMHLEVILSPAQARQRIKELAAKPYSVVPFPGNLQKGSEGFPVRVLQRELRRRPLGIDPKVDGKFGPKTAEAVNIFKKRHGMLPNGVVGRKAWNVLF